MKLYRIPNPWDYHEQGAIVVMAESAEDALSKASVLAAKNAGSYTRESIQWDKVTEIEGDIYEDGGCDC